MQHRRSEDQSVFHNLTPEAVLDAAERALGEPLSNLCRTLNSYINRVYELQTSDGRGVIAKFYRPGRWDMRALEQEHAFLLELAESELPVVAPLRSSDGLTLHFLESTAFALFPKQLGRSIDELNDSQLEQLGRLLGRVHAIGQLRPADARIQLTPQGATRSNLEYILQSDVVPRDLRGGYSDAVARILDLITPMFDGVPLIRIHGDCQTTNVVSRGEDSLHLIDFDDMAMGPAVHDLWMFLPEYGTASLGEIDTILEGYTVFRSFDRRELRLIEPLRAMRYVYFTAWCAMQVVDMGYTRLDPSWGTDAYWRQAIADLREQHERIEGMSNAFWGI